MAEDTLTLLEKKKELLLKRKAILESGGGQAEEQQQPTQPIKKKGTFEKVADVFKKDVATKLPGTMQFAGGITGGAIGTPVGAPARGTIAGGTIGRTIGEIMQDDMINTLNDPIGHTRDRGIAVALGGGPLTATINKMPFGRKREVGQNALKAFALESVIGGAGKVVTKTGVGALKALLGPRIAERGLKVGFGKLLDPKFYKDRIDKTLASKLGSFFQRVTNVSGQNVQKAVSSKANIVHSMDDIVKQGDEILNGVGANTVDDLVSPMTPKAQVNRIKEVQKIFDNLTGKGEASIPTIWEARKKMDKIIFKYRWSDDAQEYLMGLRNTLNKPIVSSGDDVALSFGQYEFVRNQEKKLGNKLAVDILPKPGGKFETFAQSPESLSNTILGGGKDETIRVLTELDEMLNVEDRVIEDFINSAAAESLDKPVELMGLKQRGLLGSVGGRKAIANIGRTLQSGPASAIRTGTERGIATTGTELSTQF